MKTLAYNIEQELGEAIILLGLAQEGKAQLMLLVSKGLTEKYHAGTMIRELAKHINGGGGGQPFFASAGGGKPQGISAALNELTNMI
jgi:alanyl-tRNA synthetase